MVSAKNDPNRSEYKDARGNTIYVGDTKAAREGAARARSKGSSSAQNDPSKTTYTDNSGNPVYVGSTENVRSANARSPSSGNLPSDNPQLKAAVQQGKAAGIDNADLVNIATSQGTRGLQQTAFVQQAKKAGYSDSAINRSLATGQPLLPSESKAVKNFVRTQLEAGYSPDAVQRAVTQGTPLLPSDNTRVQAQVRGLQGIGTNEEAAAFGALPISQSVVAEQVSPAGRYGSGSYTEYKKPTIRQKAGNIAESIAFGFKNPAATTLSEKDVTNVPAAGALARQLGVEFVGKGAAYAAVPFIPGAAVRVLAPIVGPGAASAIVGTAEAGTGALFAGAGAKQTYEGTKSILKGDVVPGALEVGMGATNVALGVFGVKAGASAGIKGAEQALVPRVVSRGKSVEVTQSVKQEFTPAVFESRAVDGVSSQSLKVGSRAVERSAVVTPVEVKAEIASGKGKTVLEVRNIAKQSQGKTLFTGKLQTGSTTMPVRSMSTSDAIADAVPEPKPIVEEIIITEPTPSNQGIVIIGEPKKSVIDVVGAEPTPLSAPAPSAPIADALAAPVSSSSISASPSAPVSTSLATRNQVISMAATQSYIRPTPVVPNVQIKTGQQVGILKTQDIAKSDVFQVGETEYLGGQGEIFAFNKGKQVRVTTSQQARSISEPQALSDDERALKGLFGEPAGAKTYRPTDGINIRAELEDTYTLKGRVRSGRVTANDIQEGFSSQNPGIKLPDNELDSLYGANPSNIDRQIASRARPAKGSSASSKDIVGVGSSPSSPPTVEAVPIIPEVITPLGSAETTTQGTIRVIDESTAVANTKTLQSLSTRAGRKVSGSRTVSRISTEPNPKTETLFSVDTPTTFRQGGDFVADEAGNIFSSRSLAKRSGVLPENEGYKPVSDLTDGEAVGVFKEPIQRASVEANTQPTLTIVESTTTPLFGTRRAASERAVFEEQGNVVKSLSLEPISGGSVVRKEKGALKFTDSPQNNVFSDNELRLLPSPSNKARSATVKLSSISTPKDGTTGRSGAEIIRANRKIDANIADEKRAKNALESLFNGRGAQQTVFAEAAVEAPQISATSASRFAKSSYPRVDATQFVQESVPILPTTFQPSNRLNSRVIVLPPSAGSQYERRSSLAPSQVFGGRFASAPAVLTRSPSAVSQKPAVRQADAQSPMSGVGPASVQKPASKALQKPATSQAPELVQETVFRPTVYRPTRLPRVRTPRPVQPEPPEPDKPKNDSDDRKKRKLLFDVFIRRRGKFAKATRRPLTEEQAKSFGAFEVKRSAAATFEYRPSQSQDEGSFNIKETLRGFYRQGVNRFIQKANTRIGTPEEKREITYKGIQARRGSSIFSRRR